MNAIFRIFILIFILHGACYSQNYVNNHSFEDIFSCPTMMGVVDSCKHWISFGYTPDYFNACGVPGCQVPANWIGWQLPFDGNGYMGIATCATHPNAREYIGTKLINSLMIGKKYFVYCYVCRGNDVGFNAATNKIGFRFSTQPFSANFPCPTDNYAQVYCTNIITDSINWTKIGGSFIADSTYMYLGIGNFFDDQHTDTLDLFDPWHVMNTAYYFIDYVCVADDSLINCDLPLILNNEIKQEDEINIYINNSNNTLYINSNIQEFQLTLTSISGKILLTKYLHEGYFQFILNDIKEGIYIATVHKYNGRSYIKKLIKS